MSLNLTKDLLVIDFETTGFNPYNCEITEVGYMVIDGMTGKKKESMQTLCKIKAKTIPEKIVKLTGITKERTEEGKDFLEVKKHLQEVAKDKIIVAHNLAFEAHWLDVACDIKVQYFYDTLSIDRLEHPYESSHKLGDICEREGISLTNAHQALADVEATAELVLKQLNSKEMRQKYMNVLTETQYGLDYKPISTRRVEMFARK